MALDVFLQRAENPSRGSGTDRVGRQRSPDHRPGTDDRTRADFDTWQDDGARADVAGLPDHDPADSGSIQELVHLRVVREEKAPFPEPGVVPDLDEMAVVDIDPG